MRSGARRRGASPPCSPTIPTFAPTRKTNRASPSPRACGRIFCKPPAPTVCCWSICMRRRCKASFALRPILAAPFAGWKDCVVVAPDVGAAKLAQRWSRRLKTELAVIEKRRSGDDDRARAVRLVGDVKGTKALIVDDEVATAGTLVEA